MSLYYRYPEARRRRKQPETRQPYQYESDPEELVGTIAGRQPDSVLEWRFYKSLLRLGWEGRFGYQVEILFGRRVRGGQVIDFLVDTVPFPTACYINDRYWHPNSDPERFKRELASIHFGGRVRIQVFWARDLSDQSTSDRSLRETVGSA